MFVKFTSYGKTHSTDLIPPFNISILIMSNSAPALSDIQLTPEIQTLFERILNQKLRDDSV
jgi:hypothetical protein